MQLAVYTIGGGDLLYNVFNAVAAIFNNTKSLADITSLAVMLGTLIAVFEFSKSKDLSKLLKFSASYVLVSALVIYPKVSVAIEDLTGFDIKPRIIDNVPLTLATFANVSSRIGIGLSQRIEAVFHTTNNMEYSKTGMLMGAQLILGLKDLQITDPKFSATITDFMQQCVFYDLLLGKYTISELMNAENPWGFIGENTSVARAFTLNGEVTACRSGAKALENEWKVAVNNAASIYGSQIVGDHKKTTAMLLANFLTEDYGFLTAASTQGEQLLSTNVLKNALSQALMHYSATNNSSAALQVYMQSKIDLQTRNTMVQTGLQSAVWLPHFVNILQAVLYALFIIVYFLSYTPFSALIIRNYICGMFYLQSLAPMYAIINFAATIYQESSINGIIGISSATSIASTIGVTKSSADALALASYLIWPVTIGAAVMLWRGMSVAMQGYAQFVGGVPQNVASHVVAEGVGGNLSVGNTNFGNHSFSNVNGNHWDTSSRFITGGTTWQSANGISVSVMADGSEVMDNRAAQSNLGIGIDIADSIRASAAQQSQMSLSAGLNQLQAAGSHYSAGIRQIDDFGNHLSHFTSSGQSYSTVDSSGFSHSAHSVSQLVESFAKDHNITHDHAAQVLGQVYADLRVGGRSTNSLGGGSSGVIGKVASLLPMSAGASASVSQSARSAYGTLYSDAQRFSQENNFAETVDYAVRAAKESHYRVGNDAGERFSNSIASSFDEGNSLRNEAASSLSKADSYSKLASVSEDSSLSTHANYNQEFYTWLSKQPVPNGRGQMSREALETMVAHDHEHLQIYMDDFVKHKTQEIINRAHVSTESSIQNAYQNNNSIITTEASIKNSADQYNKLVMSQTNNLGGVDESIKSATQSSLSKAEIDIANRSAKVTGESAPLTQHIKEKIDGGEIGSMNIHSPFSREEK